MPRSNWLTYSYNTLAPTLPLTLTPKPSTVRLTVDKKLETKQFAEMQITKYREALELWNVSDKSQRHRIVDLRLDTQPLQTQDA